MSANIREFDRVMVGLRAGDQWGNLRCLFGFEDKLGRNRSKSGLHPQGITRARGKVSRKRNLASTVPVIVQTRQGERKLACAVAVSASQPWASEGASGFAIVKARQ